MILHSVSVEISSLKCDDGDWPVYSELRNSNMGGILGGLLAFYILCKPLEWLLLKRFFKNFNTVVILSSAIVFFAILILWYLKRNEPYAFHPSWFVDYFLAAVILPLARIFLNKRKTKKQAQSEVQ